jgi:hypothetical protein
VNGSRVIGSIITKQDACDQDLKSNELVAESEDKKPLITKPATAHDPELVPSTSQLHNLLKIHRNVITLSHFSVFQVAVSMGFPDQIYVRVHCSSHLIYVSSPSQSP